VQTFHSPSVTVFALQSLGQPTATSLQGNLPRFGRLLPAGPLVFRWSSPRPSDKLLGASVEARGVNGRPFGLFPSMFRLCQLIYVIGDERDVVGLRGVARKAAVRFYPARTTPDRMCGVLRRCFGCESQARDRDARSVIVRAPAQRVPRNTYSFGPSARLRTGPVGIRTNIAAERLA